MAKKSGSKAAASSATKTKAKRRKPASRSASAASKRASPGSANARSKSSGSRNPKQPQGAADVVIKLLESPLVVDLIAVGATAALAAIAESRFGRRSDGASDSAVKAAGKAAATAMGRRIANEVEEILKASKEAKDGGAEG